MRRGFRALANRFRVRKFLRQQAQKEAAILIQAGARGFRARLHWQDDLRSKRAAATAIAGLFRVRQARLAVQEALWTRNRASHALMIQVRNCTFSYHMCNAHLLGLWFVKAWWRGAVWRLINSSTISALLHLSKMASRINRAARRFTIKACPRV